MASAYLGPETHRPLAVISESYQTRFKIPIYDETEKYRFGKDYEKQLFGLVHDHLELGTTDKLSYVGDLRGSLADAIEEHFCLIHPVQSVIPGHFHYAETDGNKMVPIRIAHVGAEEYFRNLAADESVDKPQYDRILVKDAVRYLAEPRTTYKNMAASLAKGGKLLLIHRPSDLSTLPYFNDAKTRLSQNDVAYMNIIKDLQSCRLDVTWELECLPLRMPKNKWLAMVRDKFPTHMEVLSQLEVLSGIRELTEGMLKYEGDTVEFMDRLLFITATASTKLSALPSVQRSGVDEMCVPQETHLKYVMKMSQEQLIEIRRKPDDDDLC